jgi:hypothetical protein
MKIEQRTNKTTKNLPKDPSHKSQDRMKNECCVGFVFVELMFQSRASIESRATTACL